MELTIHNPIPQYAIIDDFISDELAQRLISIVDRDGVESDYSGNTNTLEKRLAYQGINQNKGIVVGDSDSQEELRTIAELHRLVYPLQGYLPQIFKNTAMEFITGHNGFWIMKYNVGGEFEEHVDWSVEDSSASTPAVATLCVALNDDYEGGGSEVSGEKIATPLYGGAVWDGWTFHRALPVTEGSRYVLCIHFMGVLKS
jgi:hypothetical protein